MKQKYKFAIKFYTETNNEEQLEIAYKEIDSFMDSFISYKWFYKFEVDNFQNRIRMNTFLNENEKYYIITKFRYLINDSYFNTLLFKSKHRICDEIFTKGNFNVQLLEYAYIKVTDHDRVNEHKKDNVIKPKPYSKFDFLTSTTNYLGFPLLMIFISFAMIFSHYYLYPKNVLLFRDK